MLFHSEIRQGKLNMAILDPVAFRALRRLGIQIIPPLFLPLWLNMLIIFIAVDVPLTAAIVIWPVFYPEVPLMGLILSSFITTIASGVLAMILSLTWWHNKIRLELPEWDNYGAENR